jgi:hypothetical protein
VNRISKRTPALETVIAGLGFVGIAFGYGIAQGTVVTEAEWAVYLAQGLGLDWNLPPNAKSNHYLARLEWTKALEFQAAQMLDGSTVRSAADGSVQSDGPSPGEALYEVSMLRAGDYGFRVKLGGGAALLKIADRAYEIYQPEMDSRWVDLDRVRLSAGAQRLSLLLPQGTRADAIGVSPPCMLPVEPTFGWQPLEPLRFDQMAVTLARALELEKNLPVLGDPLSLRGESFIRTLTLPMAQDSPLPGDEPFWLAAGPAIVTAVARFEVPEAGIYSIEPRYLSDHSVRWNLDSCLRVITCPAATSQAGRRRSLALPLEAGKHEIEVTLGPGAKLDRVDIQRRDGTAEAYIRVVEEEGFKMGEPSENVLRREALTAARRLGDRFLNFARTRCGDGLIAMEASAFARSAASATLESPEPGISGPFPAPAPVNPAAPVFPPVIEEPAVASPVQPAR